MKSEPLSSSEKQLERVQDLSITELNATDIKKRSRKGIVLVPQPSDDLSDPLNWSIWKKVLVLGVVSLAAFIGLAQALANQAGFFLQAELYHKTPVEISYSISAAAAGLATGPLLWTPLSQRIGRSSLIFWTMVGTCACSIWAAEMQDSGDYIPFVLSRWLGGTFGACPGTIGAGIVIDIFYLHQRGKAFAVYTTCQLFGALMGPTVGGLALCCNPWPVQLWWTVGVEAAVIILVFFFLEETQYDRRDGAVTEHRSWIANRLATFFPGNKILPPRSGRRINSPLSCFLIMVCPVTILAGSFLCLTFGWAVAVNTLLAVFLQTPTKAGGYGFTPTQNSLFTFGQWIGIGTAFGFNGLFNDRVPLWACQRFGRGVWKPEYRLYPLLVPLVLLPIGLGIFGASLQYQLHFMVLALGDTIIIFAEHILTPVIINYVVEGFTHHAAEVTAVLNFYRLFLGTIVPFFINDWEAAVGGAGWVFGMMAFFSLLGFAATGVLAWKGPAIRMKSFDSLRASEEGVDLDFKHE